MSCFIVQRRKRKSVILHLVELVIFHNFLHAYFLLFPMSEMFLDIGLQAMSHNYNAEKIPCLYYSPKGHKELDMTEVTQHIACTVTCTGKKKLPPVKRSSMVFVNTFPKNPNFQSFITSADSTSEKVIPSVVIMSDIAQAQARHVKPSHLQYFFASLCLLCACLVELMKSMQRSIWIKSKPQ